MRHCRFVLHHHTLTPTVWSSNPTTFNAPKTWPFKDVVASSERANPRSFRRLVGYCSLVEAYTNDVLELVSLVTCP